MANKFVHYRTDDGAILIGIKRDAGRIERVFSSVDDSAQSLALAKRAVDALNACAQCSDGTIELMASGGTRYGSLTERIVICSLLWGENGRLAERLLERARKEIAKADGAI